MTRTTQIRIPTDAGGARAASGPLQLVVAGPGTVATVVLPEKGTVTIGRGREADICIDDPMASRVHARINIAPGSIEVEDLDSMNGTIMGDREFKGETVSAAPGDTITIGETLLMIQQLPRLTKSRRIWSHTYFLGRLEEECLKIEELRMRFAVLRLRLAEPVASEKLSEALARELGAVDLVATFGGHDYEVLLPGMGPDEVEPRVKRIKDIFRKEGIACRVGVACCPRDGQTCDALMAHASESLHGKEHEAGAKAADVVLEDQRMAEVYAVAALAAKSEASVLITGETGVGKDVLARWIHEHSRWKGHPFVHVDLTAMAESIAEGELFGYQKGAFTGAARAKAGLLEIPDGGTIFLNEIGEISPALQVKLLRAVQDRMIRRMGETADRPIGVRWIAATNKDLRALVAAGAFREDLYFRLAVVMLVLPPLRERLAEIEPLARHFVKKFCEREGRSPRPELSTEAIAMLEAYDWPGNIRELANVIERAVVMCAGAVIGPDNLPEAVREKRPEAETGGGGGALAGGKDEKARIMAALEQARWRPLEAAKILGVSRTTLWKRMKALGVPLSRVAAKPKR